MQQTILALDLGTGGIKAALYAAAAPCEKLADAFCEYPTYTPAADFREQKPEDWWHGVRVTVKAALAKAGLSGEDVCAVGVSGHSLGIVPLDAAGKLCAETTPIWSDSRAGAEAERFFASVPENTWYMETGGGFACATYPIFKLMWLRAHDEALYQRAVRFIGTKDYINYRLTGQIATDPSYASGCGAYSLRKEAYCLPFMEAAGLKEGLFPDIAPSGAVMGRVTKDAAAKLGIREGAAVVCGGVDNALMALGAGCFAEGEHYLSLGTSAWIAVSGRQPVLDAEKKPFVFQHCVPGQFLSSTGIFSAGDTLRWVRDRMFGELEKDAAYAEINRLAALSPCGAHGLMMNPSLAGGSEIEPSPLIRGALMGLEARHTRGDAARAAMEGVAMSLRTARDVLAHSCELPPQMLIVGGGAKSPLWMQIFADVLGERVLTSRVGQDCAALGAAALCAQALGICSIREVITHAHGEARTYDPGEDQPVYAAMQPAFERAAALIAQVSELIRAEWKGE
ncbi:MAG: pentose kinase [Clostridia bacterium]|nr:pentose kinase [Clostridia bacterium]